MDQHTVEHVTKTTTRTGQKTARAKATNDTLKPGVARDAVYFELFDEDTAGLRPGLVTDCGPLERVQRHIVEQLTDFVRVAPMVQIFDGLVPQTVGNPMDAFRVMDQPIAEQVTAVPKIVDSSCPSRVVSRDPQMAEQLVEVPTVLSFASHQQLVSEQIVDIPVPGGGLRVFPGPGGSSSSAVSHDERGQGVFRTSPRPKKKSEVRRKSEDDEGFFVDDAGNVWTKTSMNTWVDPLGESWPHFRRDGAERWWNLDTQHTQWQPP